MARYTGVAMNPKYRPVILLVAIVMLMAPYFGFVIYYSQQFPRNQIPAWFTNTLLIWFTANFFALILIFRLSRKFFKSRAIDAEKVRVFTDTAVRTSTVLVIFWSLLFIYGVIKTLQGTIPLERAIPAGAFLLLFIGLFGWSIWRAKRAKKAKAEPLT